MIAPKTAAQKPVTVNPGIRPDAIFSISALMTKVNRPNERMFMGNVRINRIGRKNRLRIPNAAAAKKALKKPAAEIPSTT